MSENQAEQQKICALQKECERRNARMVVVVDKDEPNVALDELDVRRVGRHIRVV